MLGDYLWIYVLRLLELLMRDIILMFDFASGTSEAFLHAVATENQLKRSNDSLLVFSLIYVALNVLLIRSAGAVGLIFANSLSILIILRLFFLAMSFCFQ